MRGLRLGLGLSPTKSADPYPDYALALDFKNGIYRKGNVLTQDVTSLSGYSYARSGAKAEIGAAGPSIAFAANVPGILPGIGYWARGGMTNLAVHSGPTVAQLSSASGVADNAAPPSSPVSFANWIGIANPAVDTWAYVGAPALASSTLYTISFFVHAPDGVAPVAGAQADAGADFTFYCAGVFVAGPYNYQYLGNNVWRCWTTGTTINPVTNFRAGFVHYAATQRQRVLHFSGFQVVAGAQPGPIIVTIGAAASVAADRLRVDHILPAGDQLFLVTANIVQSIPNVGYVASFDAASSNNRFMLYITGGNLFSYCETPDGVQAMNRPATTATTLGRQSILVAYRSGVPTTAYRKVDGTILIGATNTAGALPTVTGVDAGSHINTSHLNGIVEFIGHRRGTFSDADLVAILEAA